MLADAPGIIKRSLNQRRRQSLAAKSILDDRVVELAGIARVYVVASTRLSTVHGEDVTGFIGLVCNSGLRVKKCVRNRGFSRIDL